MVPLETSDPHPFISLLMPIKGKKMLPRVMRFFDTARNLTIVTLMVACFSQLDVVRNSAVLDRLGDSLAYKEAVAQSEAFVHMTEMQYVLLVSAKCSLRIVSGLLGLFLERNDVVAMTQTPVSSSSLHVFRQTDAFPRYRLVSAC